MLKIRYNEYRIVGDHMKACLQNQIVKNKRVILRVDYNVPIKNGIILDDSKIKETLETIFYLISENCKIIIMSHLGKVKNEEDKKKNTLEPIAIRLKQLLGKEVYFSKINYGNELLDRVDMMQPGDILMIENTRFMDFPNKLESNCDLHLAKFWASLGDIYVNDAFGCAHRKHASTYGISKYLPSCIGFLMQKEINMLDRLVVHPIHPFTVIMGGAKIDDKIALMEALLPKCEHLLCGGGIANTCLEALGFPIGESIASDDPEILARVKSMLFNSKDKIMLPLDAIVGSTYDEHYIKYKLLNEINANDVIYDVGVKTLQKYQSVISTSQTIFINGTVGEYELPQYANGTKELLKMITKSKAITVAGGGDASSSVYTLGYGSKFTYISSGGGATLDYLATGKLVALEAIPEEDDDTIETLNI